MQLTLIALGLLLLTSPSRAAEEVPKRHAISAEFFFPEDVDNRDIRVATLSAEAERYLVRGLWLRGAVGVGFTEGELLPDEGPQSVGLEADGVGLGVGGFVRWLPMRSGGIGPFVEGGLGMLFTTERFPPRGTVWNFSPRHGFGVDVQISARLNLVVAYRHVHFSNGKGFGHPRNPSYDGDGVMVAISW